MVIEQHHWKHNSIKKSERMSKKKETTIPIDIISNHHLSFQFPPKSSHIQASRSKKKKTLRTNI